MLKFVMYKKAQRVSGGFEVVPFLQLLSYNVYDIEQNPTSRLFI